MRHLKCDPSGNKKQTRLTRKPVLQVVALPDASSAPVSPAAAAYGAVWAVAQTAATAVTLPLAIGLVVLLGWVAYLVCNNKTTIEYHEARLHAHTHPRGSITVTALPAVSLALSQVGGVL